MQNPMNPLNTISGQPITTPVNNTVFNDQIHQGNGVADAGANMILPGAEITGNGVGSGLGLIGGGLQSGVGSIQNGITSGTTAIRSGFDGSQPGLGQGVYHQGHGVGSRSH